MVEKVKRPIKELQKLRSLDFNPLPAASSDVVASPGQNPKNSTNLEELQLERVIGTSSKGANSLQTNPINGDVCYLAGSRIVIYSPRDAKQIKFLASRTARPFQCVRFSNDGKYLAAGESAFRQPQITIWEIAYEEEGSAAAATEEEGQRRSEQSGDQSQAAAQQPATPQKKVLSYTEIKHLQGHKYGIESVVFSPRNDFLISLGDPNDKGLFVWDW